MSSIVASFGWSASGLEAIVIVVAAAALLIWQARVMRGPQRALRWTAWSILVVALALLVLEPNRPAPPVSGPIVLITEGAPNERGALASDDARPRFALPSVDADASGGVLRGSTLVPDLEGLLRSRVPSRVEVVGHGLEPWEAVLLADTEVMFSPPPAPRGFVWVDWSRQVGMGEAVVVRGALWGADDTARGNTVELLDPAGVVDRATVSADGTFALAARPRVEGRLRYRLRFVPADEGVSFEERLDVDVAPSALPKVLWLASSPSFETRHLGDWLVGRGGALAVRTAISRDRFRFARFNFERADLPDADLRRLDAELLDRFDVVIADERFLTSLSARAASTLRASVDRGLGLLVLPSALDERAPFGEAQTRGIDPAFDWPLVSVLDDLAADMESDEDEAMQVRVDWGAEGLSTPITMPAWGLDDDDAAATDRLRPLAVDAFGRVLAAARSLGAGQVGVSLLDRSYRFVLGGDADDHRRWWSGLLGGLARPRTASSINVSSGPVLVDRPVTVEVLRGTVGDSADDVSKSDLDLFVSDPSGLTWRLDLQRDARDPGRLHATFWPNAEGWHRLEMDDTTLDLDVQPIESWSAWQQTRRRKVTQQLATSQAHPSPSTTSPSVSRLHAAPPRPMLRLSLFLLALAGAGTLWAVERRARRRSG